MKEYDQDDFESKSPVNDKTLLSFHKLSSVPIHRDYALTTTRLQRNDDIMAFVPGQGKSEENFFSI